jgi:hypothetical protein
MFLIQRGLWTTVAGAENIFSVFGDGAYNLGLPCIASYFRNFGGGVELTVDEDFCNRHMRSARVTIEKNFGMVSYLFCICNMRDANKLAKNNPTRLSSCGCVLS